MIDHLGIGATDFAASRRFYEAALAPLGIVAGGKNGDASGSDISEIQKLGIAVIELGQDGTRYFDLHHTADDTLDKIDSVQLRQNVAAWTAMLAVMANAPEDLSPPKH